MTTLHLLFSHQISEAQEQEARQRFGVQRILPLSPTLQQRWSDFPPTGPLGPEEVAPFCTYLTQNAQEDDLVLIQGDFGAVVLMVSYCLSRNLVPIYATTYRRVTEHTEAGRTHKTSTFEHVQFRHYQRLPD
jgi:hypothetical protein